jgi:type III secretory pathway component EscS
MKTKQSDSAKNSTSGISEFLYSKHYSMEAFICLIRNIIFFPNTILSRSIVSKIWYTSIVASCLIAFYFTLKFGESKSVGQCVFFGIIVGIVNAVAHIKKESLQPLAIILSVLLWIAVFHFNTLNIPDIKMGWLKWESFFSGIIGYYWFLVRERE